MSERVPDYKARYEAGAEVIATRNREIAALRRELAEAREREGRLREGLEQIASNLCYCEGMDKQECPCDVCISKALLDRKSVHDAIAVHHPEILATPADDASGEVER